VACAFPNAAGPAGGSSSFRSWCSSTVGSISSPASSGKPRPPCGSFWVCCCSRSHRAGRGRDAVGRTRHGNGQVPGRRPGRRREHRRPSFADRPHPAGVLRSRGAGFGTRPTARPGQPAVPPAAGSRAGQDIRPFPGPRRTARRHVPATRRRRGKRPGPSIGTPCTGGDKQSRADDCQTRSDEPAVRSPPRQLVPVG
jgi:hypothetical protein